MHTQFSKNAFSKDMQSRALHVLTARSYILCRELSNNAVYAHVVFDVLRHVLFTCKIQRHNIPQLRQDTSPRGERGHERCFSIVCISTEIGRCMHMYSYQTNGHTIYIYM